MNEFVKVLEHYGLFLDSPVYKVLCPFHKDKNPSLQINVDKGYFHCYGCEAHGGPLELISYFEPGLNKLQANIKLQEITQRGNKTPFKALDAQVITTKRLSQKQAVTQARAYYESLPDPNWYKPRDNQVIHEETLTCRQYMKSRGFSNRLLTDIGAKPSLNPNYPIIFPLVENEVFRGYVLRTFDPEIENKRKYLYNTGFRRQLTLPGKYDKQKPIILVEGYLDCLKGLQLGFKNVAALLGWKISKKQLNKIKRKHITTIICALDNDEAGNKGYTYLKQICKAEGITVYRLNYPNNVKDFGDINKNTQELKEIKEQVKKLIYKSKQK